MVNARALIALASVAVAYLSVGALGADECASPTQCNGYTTFEAIGTCQSQSRVKVAIAGITATACFHCDGKAKVDASKFPYVTCDGLPLCSTVKDSQVSMSLAPKQLQCLLAKPANAESCLQCDANMVLKPNSQSAAALDPLHQNQENGNQSAGTLNSEVFLKDVPSVSSMNSPDAVVTNATFVQVGGGSSGGNSYFPNVEKTTTSHESSASTAASSAFVLMVSVVSMIFLV